MDYSVGQLKSLRKKCKNQRKEMARRKDVMSNIANKSRSFDNYYYDIKTQVDSCTGSLSSGVKNISGISRKCNEISALKEQTFLTNQGDFSNAIGYIQKEVAYCDNEIIKYNNKIKQYEKKIKEKGGTIWPWE